MRLAEILQPVVRLERRQLKRQGGNLELVETDGAYVVVEVKLVQLFQK